MQLVLILPSCMHVLAGVFWTGGTFTLARMAGVGADRLFVPQLGAASFTIPSGIYLWDVWHRCNMGASGQVLAGDAPRRRQIVEIALRRFSIAHRFAAILLVVTAICMASARFFQGV